MQLIVTRPLAQAAGWVDALHALGQPALALPLIAIEPVADAAALQAAWSRIDDYALVMFVSANAVKHFFAAAPDAAGAALAWPTQRLAGSTGPGTSAALRAAGIAPAALVEPAPDGSEFDSEALWARLQGHDWQGRRALVVRGEGGRDWLSTALTARGAQVDFVAAYRRCCPVLDAPACALLARALAEPARHLWLLSASESLLNLRTLAPQADWSRSSALASHPRIARAARDLGFGRVEIVTPQPGAVAQQAAGWASIQSQAP